MSTNGTEHETMIERVAKAIWEANAPPGAPDWEGLTGSDQYMVEIIAIECIKAMKEPTDIMLVAAEDAVPELSCFNEKKDSPSYRAWQAAIEAALNEV